MYKTGDKIVPLIGNYKGQVCTITEVEDRTNGAITFQLNDGRKGLMFRNEIREAWESELRK